MSLRAKIIVGLIVALLVAVFGYGWHIRTVYAGYTASTDSGDALYPRETLEDYGQQILNELTAKNVKLAIVSRAGQTRDKLPDGVMFTHSAFFRRNATGGYDVYNLYHGEENRLRSTLVTDTPTDFLRLLQEPDAGILIPDAQMQDQLFDMLESPKYAAVHQADYSLISNPFDLRWQNCNELMLFAIAAVIWDTTDRKMLRNKLAATITPTELKVSPLRRHFGPMIDERLILDDHDERVLTTTFGTLTQLIDISGHLDASYILMFDN
ncbi:hypothetical protein GCM10011309_02660 [Litorimonas cladophorae]|uniref:DUF2145 domain-containing protein n=1 Tax=Litorimonas cladophorae TaxID=1220491 RepID=A0A918N9U7_9PROT|nr:DUF2145 domain-containing protein [Litorimonas cladophorae]GGX57195.1 hypothetical protein GCM10011309_02660 [Litorimonas cladophorae]